MKRIILFGFLLSLCFSSYSQTSPEEMKLYDENDEALKWFRKAVEGGNALAMIGLGYMYENGNGVKQDYAEALKWYRKAAENGVEDAKDKVRELEAKGVR